MSHKKYTEEQQRLLKQVVDHFDKEDSAIRERQIRTWRRLKLFWEGFQNIWYSEVAHDWRIYDATIENQDNDQAYYDKKINVFRAYLESIIAALSITVPPIKCYPDDADNTLDLLTARAGDKIAQLVYRHNDVSLLWLHGLFIFCTEGLVACYSYPKEDEKYGTYEKKEYKDELEEHEIASCPSCGYTIDDKTLTSEESNIPLQTFEQNFNPNIEGIETGMEGIEQDQTIDFDKTQYQDEYMPGNENIEFRDAIMNEQDICPSCMAIMNPEIKRESFVVTRLVGITHEPKARICLEAYGGLNVKIPNYARKQSDCPYLIYSYETHYANVIERYEHLHDKELGKKIQGGGGGAFDSYEQWGRLSPQYQGEYPINNITVRNAWLRHAAFNILDKDEAKKLKALFPDGANVVLVNDEFADACNESLDDCWTLTHNPLSDYLHHDPLGSLLVSVQEITTDLISLIIQTIEHGIGLTFADPDVLNFKAFGQTEVLPGGVFPAKPKSGKSLNDAFHDIKTASLSGEVLPFVDNIQSMGQLVSGALPSLFGGQLQGSETASQYSMSRAQALQRLQNSWKIFIVWWKNIFGKVIPMYIKEVKEDERDVHRNSDGSFINAFIRKAELEGKIGKVELEASENLPITWSQQKDIVMSLLQSSNPEILQVLGITSPENLDVIRDAIGLVDFYVPGEDDREKQYDEIKLLLNSEPIVIPPDPMMVMQAQMMGQPPPQETEVSSIEIDPEIDNHNLEFEICRKWLISEAGRQTKTDNPSGYKNVLLHAKEHLRVIQQQQMQQMAPPEEQGAVPIEKPNGKSMKSAPITGEENVNTVQ